MIFEEYYEELQHVPFEQALSNMKLHSRESDFFPSIAVLFRKPVISFYDDHKQLSQDNKLQLEEKQRTAVPMPTELFKEWLDD